MRRFQDLVRPPARKASRFKGRCFQAAVENIRCCLSTNRGNVLVYIVMVMLVFAALGVTMLSLFSTSTSSSAVANSDRRAFNLYESGYRYALSELTGTSFSSGTVTALNATTYSLPPNGQFLLNVFRPGFDATSTATQDLIAGQSLNLSVPRGKLPAGFAIPVVAPYVSVVNFEYVGTSITASGSSAEVTGYSYTDPTHFSLTVGDDFVANNTERICLAVHPAINPSQTVSYGGDLTVDGQARDIFPKRNGAIEVNTIAVKRKLLFYRELYDTGGSQVVLKNLSGKDGSFPNFDVAATDYVILSPANYYIVPEGRSGGVTYGASMDYAVSAYDVTPFGPEDPPDIEFGQENLSTVLSKRESVTGFANVDNFGKKVTFQQTSGSPFGSVFFNDTRAIGGLKNYCLNGACLFEDGIRAFFVMTFAGPGDGFTFSLLSAGPPDPINNPTIPNNTASSVGGDFDMGELMGYAGDSRIPPSPSPMTYLDGTGNGLRPPKMAVEFDGFYNNSPVAYCADAVTVNHSTRFDPDFPPGSGSGKDAVQYVFWGSRNPLLAPCRGNKQLYDDNRHAPQENSATQQWNITVGLGYDDPSLYSDKPYGNSRLAIAPDGTSYVIYVYSGYYLSSTDGRVRAVRPLDGSVKWSFQPIASGGDDDPDSIAVDLAGNIFVGTNDKKVISLNSSGGQRWIQPVDSYLESPMAISETRNEVYAVSRSGALYAFGKTTGSPAGWSPLHKAEAGDALSGVTIDPTDGTLYFGSDNGRLYAVRSTGSQRWSYLTSPAEPIRSRPSVNPVNRDIIFGSNNNYVYALPYASSSTPSRRWRYLTNGNVIASPTITPDGLRVYVGNTAGVFYALNASDGSLLWQYPSSGSIGAIKGAAAIDADGTIYFGTEAGKLYAMDPNGSVKWTYNAGSGIRAEPKIGPNGIVYFLTANGQLHAVNPFTSPVNLRSLSLTDGELQAGVSGADWFGLGTWAVRVEVDRSQTVNGKGNYEYTLRTWMRKCPDAACSDIADTLFGSTRLRYDYNRVATPDLPMTQTIELSSADHALLNRFLFGFTSASGTNQTIDISNFQLSFIRPNDPVILTDPDWP